MTPEELLKPRFKVIADYPDAIKNVGEIFITNETGVAYVTENSKYDARQYPHLFQPLEWYEERKVEDMPEYVKRTGMVDSYDKELPDIILKVKKHFNAGNGEWRNDAFNIFCADSYITELKNCTYHYFEHLPATEQDYNDCIKTKTV